MKTWILSSNYNDVLKNNERLISSSDEFDKYVYLEGVPQYYKLGKINGVYDILKSSIEAEMWNIEAHEYERPVYISILESTKENENVLILLQKYFKDNLIIK